MSSRMDRWRRRCVRRFRFLASLPRWSMGPQVYSDGGAVNNLPVNVARAMGADIVIAVYLDTGPFDKKTLGSLVGVAGRNVDIMVAANELNSMKDANIL